jgi:Ran GTPase-activating protein (RanGAP) involved in mRNA processing and transport
MDQKELQDAWATNPVNILIQLADRARHLNGQSALFSLLSENDIKNYYVKFLHDTVKNRLVYQKIVLSIDDIRDEEIMVVADFLKRPYNAHIKELEISTDITIQGWKYIADMLKYNRSLTYLYINDERFLYKDDDIVDDKFLILADGLANSSIKILKLKGCVIESTTIKYLMEALAFNPIFEKLSSIHSDIDDQSAVYIANFIKHNQHFKHLNLNYCNITKFGAAAIARSLSDSQLISLNLTGNNIEDEGAISLAESLRYNRTITKLKLTKCNIGVRGISNIVNNIRNDNFVLVIGVNNIGPIGGQYIGQILNYDSHIISLDLRKCNIGDQGLIAIVNGLVDNKNNNMLELQLGANNITNESVSAIIKLLTNRNIRLRMLNINNNEISNENLMTIYRYFKYNKYLTNIYIDSSQYALRSNIDLSNRIHKTNIEIRKGDLYTIALDYIASDHIASDHIVSDYTASDHTASNHTASDHTVNNIQQYY